MNPQKKDKMKFAGIIMIITGIVTILCLLIFILFGNNFLLKSGIEFEADQAPASQSQGASSSISIPGFESINIQAGASRVSSPLYNPDGNACYFEITVTLDSNGEEIYKSKYLAPGQHLYEIELNRSLSVGSYDATIHYSTYSVEDLTPLNGANVPVKLVVK